MRALFFIASLLAILLLPRPAPGAEAPPDFNPDKIINESFGFLKDREPQMTDSEYALYEQVVPMVFQSPDFALTLLETMLEDEEPESPAFTFILANVYFSQHRYAEAERNFRQAIEAFPQFLRAWENLALLYYSQRRYAEAVPCLAKAVELGNQEAQIRGLLGYCLVQINHPLAAEAAFQQALTADPLNPDWIEALLSLYMDSGQHERAEALVRQLIRLEPEKAALWHLYASLLLSAERRLEAMTALEVATRAGWTAANEQILLGDLYAEQKLYAEAAAIYRGAMAKTPATATERLLAYLEILVLTGSLGEAETLLATLSAHALPGMQRQVREAEASLRLAQGDTDAAAALFQRILQEDPLNGETLLSLGRLERERGDPVRAEFHFRQACEVPATAFRANLELANLAILDRNYREGAQCLEKALRIEHHPELETYLIRIRALVADSAPPPS